jgi:hypothetical protein
MSCKNINVVDTRQAAASVYVLRDNGKFLKLTPKNGRRDLGKEGKY